MATLNPYEEARLYTTSSEREQWENFATLFSLIVTLDYLELAYVRGGVTEAAYTPACTRLLAQYKTALKLVLGSPSSAALQGRSRPPPVEGLDEFMRMYKMDMPAAHHRLLIGVPATIEHGNNNPSDSRAPNQHNNNGTNHNHNGGPNGGPMPSGRERAKQVAETTQAFITFTDALKLKLRAKDSLHPLLSELVVCYTRSGEGAGSVNEEGRAKMLHWLIKMNQMRASEEIDEEQARQLLFEIEGAYNDWFRSLQDV
ncbi:unnamed protein product [Tilletia controversa]|uniref:Vacuolar protein sorting-associated protein 28 n=3 Tax=Tilletia TaxID=13289 RepID=A0A8X7MUA7_9BASI|nr:hypothetical protein CF336_g1869 [Tilletia laevis]KAE8203543.1 hypothetical protein CF328_g1601 [Tilletia controversa]KAE8263271.1 hypothetical protein A4X03_0g1812 [Tilletia caries]KAE8204255.1 hypothetical protein CF335_g2717 [Tilletia laevis]KAE8248731.1 hypothetical protein A4X06_0g3548 [Tilletia controversa]